MGSFMWYKWRNFTKWDPRDSIKSFKNNSDYAVSCLKTAYDEGARWIVLCDTNGGTLPHEVGEIVSKVSKIIPGKNLGIHAHNDTENAVANSLIAILSGARQIQGTINGLGERCGNANLMSVIPSLVLKTLNLHYHTSHLNHLLYLELA